MSKENLERLRDVLERITTPRVLLIEDDPLDAELTCRVLIDEGLEPAVAATAGEARKLLEANCYCLCLLDLKLPDVSDPLEFIAEMKEQRPGMAIVVLTGTLHSETLRSALEKRVLAVLLKPIKHEQLQGVQLA